jgi:phage terminase large subunit GpA-like protein
MLERIRSNALRALLPPPKLDLDQWVEQNVVIPEAIAAHPGRMRLWPHQREIARSIGDSEVERVTVLKSARVGYTQLTVAALGHYAVNDPGPVLVVLPAEQDCRTLMTGTIEPVFRESPSLRSALSANVADRDTMLARQFPGGSLRLVSAKSPRNLRGHTARVLVLDEVDAFEVDVRGEGDPVELAIRRTATYGNRKIVMGSSPVAESTSRILRAYGKSDQRVYECPCPHCGDFHEIQWADIRWQPDQPETAHWACPSCGGVVEDREKVAFIMAGRWRATAPEVTGHHGYRINALSSLLPNAAWPRLAAEFLEAKRSPETLQTFTNTVLGEAWRDGADELNEDDLRNRVEEFGLTVIPPDVLILTAGVDVQDDRLEWVIVGHGRDEAFVLANGVVWGRYDHPTTWAELDDLLKGQWPHPNGGMLRVDAALVDSGDGEHQEAVYAFARARFHRRVAASKGMNGFSRPPLQRSSVKGLPVFIVGSDSIKNRIFNSLAARTGIRFSCDLEARFFEELTSERRVVKYSRGQPTRAFERIPGKRAECLDATVYALAARSLVNMNLDRRAAEVSTPAALPRKMPTTIPSKWLNRG